MCYTHKYINFAVFFDANDMIPEEKRYHRLGQEAWQLRPIACTRCASIPIPRWIDG